MPDIEKSQTRSGKSRSRPQYHFLYGSTDVDVDESIPPPPSTIGSPGGTDDALLGEGLILTDNEEDHITPNTSHQDLQQIVVTNGDGTTLPPLATYDVDATEASELLLGPVPPPLPPPPPPPPKAWCSRCCHRLAGNFSGDHPIGHVTRVVLVMAVAICMATLVMVLASDNGDSVGGPASGYNTGPRFDYIPFPVVDREKYNDPASKIVNPDLFDPTLLFQGTKASARTNRTVDPLLKVPFPTGAFWTNLVVESTEDGFSYPVVVYPYAYKWSERLLQASYPALRRKVDEISIRDTFHPDITFGTLEAVSNRHIMAFDSLSVTTRFYVQTGGYWETYMVMGSPYITIKYQDSTPDIHALSIFSDVTCPFDADGQYKDGTGFDSFRDLSYKWGVCTPYDPLANDQSGTGLSILHGVQFLLQTNEGLTWMLFASEPIALVYDTIQKTTVTAAEKFSGVLRLALIPPQAGDETKTSSGSAPLSNSSGLRRLIYHSHVYPTGGSVSWDFRTENAQPAALLMAKRVVGTSSSSATSSPPTTKSPFALGKRPSNTMASLKFQFTAKPMNQEGSSGSTGSDTPLLMLSLPHHSKLLPQDAILSFGKFDLQYQCVKGPMSPVVGDTWTYDVSLNTLGLDDIDASAYAQRLKRGVQELIMDNVEKDLNILLPTVYENVYGYGKQVARLAQLTHIAAVMDFSSHVHKNLTSNRSLRNEGPTGSSTFNDAVDKLYFSVVQFLNGNVTDFLVYDGRFGGIVSQDGLLDKDADFGNGRYNDHHFHYGYFLYACAILGHMNETFVTEYGDHVDALMFDIAHNGNGDSLTLDSVFFPLSRHKSWYDGHSFATGLFPFGNGKSQESSSEAVNAYYGAYLWSLVREGAQDDPLFELTDFARLLLATEIQGAKTYWHLLPPSDLNNSTAKLRPTVYNPMFEKNYMVGNLGMIDAVCSTWFGTSSLYVQMINFMPVTAITSVLFNQSYVEKQFDAVLAPILPNVEMAWRGYVISEHAIVDPSAAWMEAQSLVSSELDAALSKSQVLYWISTRPGFNATATETEESDDTNVPNSTDRSHPADTTKQNSQSTKCEDNRECKKSGLEGFCCPTSDGKFLSCCSEK